MDFQQSNCARTAVLRWRVFCVANVQDAYKVVPRVADGAHAVDDLCTSCADGRQAGQGEITGSSCFPIGAVAQQDWTIDTSAYPQVIQITFSGGQEGR